MLGVAEIGGCGDLEAGDGALVVLRAAGRKQSEGEIVVGGRMAGGGGLLQQGAACLGIARQAAPFEQRHAEGEDRVDVAPVGREAIPVGGGLGIVADAEPLPVDLAEQRHRRSVLGIGLEPLQRFRLGPSIMPGLVGAVSEVRLHRRGGGEGDHQCERSKRKPHRAVLRACCAAIAASASATAARMSTPSAKTHSPSAMNSAPVSISAETDSASGQ